MGEGLFGLLEDPYSGKGHGHPAHGDGATASGIVRLRPGAGGGPRNGQEDGDGPHADGGRQGSRRGSGSRQAQEGGGGRVQGPAGSPRSGGGGVAQAE
eukprot:6663969-Heterocapsa_arctica.AAC.1